MREKTCQGVYPGHAPFGYSNNKADRTIEIDPVDSPMVIRLMEFYATGAHTLSTLLKMLKDDEPWQHSPHSKEPLLHRLVSVGRRDLPRHASTLCRSQDICNGLGCPCRS
jgi:hypothetical protein